MLFKHSPVLCWGESCFQTDSRRQLQHSQVWWGSRRSGSNVSCFPEEEWTCPGRRLAEWCWCLVSQNMNGGIRTHQLIIRSKIRSRVKVCYIWEKEFYYIAVLLQLFSSLMVAQLLKDPSGTMSWTYIGTFIIPQHMMGLTGLNYVFQSID